MKIGAQFYTIREFCKTPEGLAESLAKVADIGYRYVQISGTCPYEGAWLKEELRKNGLACVLTHIPAERLTGDLPAVIADHDTFDCRYVGLGYHPFTEEDPASALDAFEAQYHPVTKAIRESGKLFMYHNHDHEFIRVGNDTVLGEIARRFSPDELGITLDTFWVQAGGADPAQWLERLAGRVPCIHLKDYAYGRKMEYVGGGNINIDRVFEKAESAGTEYMLVEQDDCGGQDPFDCLRKSYDYLRSRGF